MRELRLLFVAGVLLFGGVGSKLAAQVSPFGTGIINNQIIGQLDDPSALFASNTPYGVFGTDMVIGAFPHPDSVLNTYTYDLYIPPSYDGTEPYGLITFINSGNNGGILSDWIPILDEKKLILIAGDNIGNSIGVHIRNGVAWAAVHRMKEILNIDTARIYSSGNSGGARMSTVLAYIYPEWIKATVPNCGASYLRTVDQDYETQNPNSNYEYTYPFTTAEAQYVQAFDQRLAIMTSYDDFREGDIMNIYHNGIEVDEMKGKFLEISGPHCTMSTQHFKNAINFIEHPYITLIMDSMDGGGPIIGNSFEMKNASLQNSKLVMEHSGPELAQAFSNDPFLWDDSYGSIITTSVQLDSTTYNQNSIFHYGLWSFTDPDVFCEMSGTAVFSGAEGILTTIEFTDSLPTLSVTLENPNQGFFGVTIFEAQLKDWFVSVPLNIKFHLWDDELRMEFSNHFNAPTTSLAGTKLLDDERSIQILWSDMSVTTFWDSAAWDSGTLLTYASEARDTAQSSSNFAVDYLELITADTSGINPVPTSTNSVTITQVGDSLFATGGLSDYQWYLDGNILDDDTLDYVIVTQDGDYQVTALTQSICQVVSNVITVTSIDVDELETTLPIQVYPNPTKDKFFVDAGSLANYHVALYDVYGNKVLSSITQENDISTLPSGVYFLHFVRGDAFATFKIVKVD